MGYIYLRTNKINGKKYVGQVTTKRFKQRQRDWRCLSQPYAGNAINRAREKYGIDAFDFEILIKCNDDELDYWETYYIKELNTKVPYGYNLTDGGGGIYGYHHTEETKRKMSKLHKGKKLSEKTKKKLSESLKGEKHYLYGKHHTEETKRKMSEVHKCQKKTPFTEEHKKHLSEAHKGQTSGMKNKKHTEESKKKMSEVKKGIPNIKLSKPVLQIDKNTNLVIEEFPSLSEIERQLGLSFKNISCCCRGITKSAYGYIWKYKESVA